MYNKENMVVKYEVFDYDGYKNKKWTESNIQTLIQWNCIAAYNIEVLEMSITWYQSIMRWNVIFGLIMSTTSGAISAARFGEKSNNNNNLILIFNYIFTFMAFSIAVFTGAIKIYQIQENLEIFIRIKQEWINFSTLLVSEFQLPVSERQDAVILIKNNKGKYLDLLKTSINIPKKIRVYGESRIKESTKRAENQSGLDMGHELVDIIYHMNNKLLNDVELLHKYDTDLNFDTDYSFAEQYYENIKKGKEEKGKEEKKDSDVGITSEQIQKDIV